MKFERYPFDPALQESLAAMGFRRPTDIQFRAIPSILKGEDVFAIAQTGTGKTAAYAIPLIQQLLRNKQRTREACTVRSLVMIPTRELATQVAEVFQQLAQFSSLQILALIGGVDEAPQVKKLKHGIDVLIATPGRMFDLQSRGLLRLDKTHWLILDEADQMLALGFLRDIQDVVKRIPRKHQTLFFSATLQEAIKDLAYSLVQNPIRIQVSPRDPVSKNVDHQVAYIEMDDKRFFLERLIREEAAQKILVFVRTRVRAERVHEAMKRVGLDSLTLHGEKDQQERALALEAFRTAACRVLIATDVSARGIDIPAVQIVVNYDLPTQAETYVHRIGRTGRGTARGKAYSFCASEEKNLLQDIEQYTGYPIRVLELDRTAYRMTRALSEEKENNWQQLMEDADMQKKKAARKKR